MQHVSLARRAALALVAAAGLTFVAVPAAGAIGARPEDPTNAPQPTAPPPSPEQAPAPAPPAPPPMPPSARVLD
jgi:hypothetical protein